MGFRVGILSTVAALIISWVSTNICPAQLLVLSTEFQAEEGYQNGDLQFQSISNGTKGTWLGHSGAAVVASGHGTVSRTADPRRNLFDRGATGGLAGGDGRGELLGAGFEIGDLLTIRHSYSFEASSATTTGLLKTGVRPNYASGGAESLPVVGLSLEYLNTGEGELRIYSNLDRVASDSDDDAYAMIVPAVDVGLDPGTSSGQPDAVSDSIMLTWIGEYIDIDTWKTKEIVVDNLTTPFTARASVVNPLALEQVTVSGTGADAFFGMQQLQNSGGLGRTDFVELSYYSSTGAIPGSFDGDLDVDGMDLLYWQTNKSSPSDLIIWQSNYGRTTLGGNAGTILVPEPSSMALIPYAIAAWSIVATNFGRKGSRLNANKNWLQRT